MNAQSLLSPHPGPVAEPTALRPPSGAPVSSGARLVAAFEDVETFPALSKSRDAMLEALHDEDGHRSLLIGVIESEPGLLLAVFRAAGRSAPRRKPVTVAEAVAVLSDAELEGVAEAVTVFDFFEQSRTWSDTVERFRVHARTTQTATESLRRALGFGPRPDLRVAALLHDIGKLVLLRAYDRYQAIWDVRGTADERLALEMTELGIDHALVGGVLARRLGLADSLAHTIERHHRDDGMGDASIIRVADMLAHYAAGGAVQGSALVAAARTIGLSTDDLRSVLDELPGGTQSAARGATVSPLTEKQTDVVRQLAEGKVYKQIAADMGLAPSTVRSHLYNTYRKLGVVDRTQAVLMATANGWL
jgi:putative nucleotidyltransferase with HDIG domain